MGSPSSPEGRRLFHRKGAPTRPTNRLRDGSRAHQGHRSSRSEAGKYSRHYGRHCKAARFWPGKTKHGTQFSRRVNRHFGCHPGRNDFGHACLYVSRASGGQASGPALRHLFLRSHPLRNAYVPSCLSGRVSRLGLRGDPSPESRSTEPPVRSQCNRLQVPVEIPRQPFPECDRSSSGSRTSFH